MDSMWHRQIEEWWGTSFLQTIWFLGKCKAQIKVLFLGLQLIGFLSNTTLDQSLSNFSGRQCRLILSFWVVLQPVTMQYRSIFDMSVLPSVVKELFTLLCTWISAVQCSPVRESSTNVLQRPQVVILKTRNLCWLLLPMNYPPPPNWVCQEEGVGVLYVITLSIDIIIALS